MHTLLLVMSETAPTTPEPSTAPTTWIGLVSIFLTTLCTLAFLIYKDRADRRATQREQAQQTSTAAQQSTVLLEATRQTIVNTLTPLIERHQRTWPDCSKFADSAQQITAHLKQLGSDIGQIRTELNTVLDNTNDLYKWHDKEDGLGVKIWYSPKEELKAIAVSIAAVDQALRQTTQQIAELNHEIQLSNARTLSASQIPQAMIMRKPRSGGDS